MSKRKSKKRSPLRIGGRPVPYAVWKAAAEEILPGPAPSRKEITNGTAKSKATTLTDLQADPEIARKTREVCSRLMTAQPKAYVAERGWDAQTTPDQPSNPDVSKLTPFELLVWQLTEREEVERHGSSTLTRWLYPNWSTEAIFKARAAAWERRDEKGPRDPATDEIQAIADGTHACCQSTVEEQ